jgi:hypothetical protein
MLMGADLEIRNTYPTDSNFLSSSSGFYDEELPNPNRSRRTVRVRTPKTLAPTNPGPNKHVCCICPMRVAFAYAGAIIGWIFLKLVDVG